MTDTNAPRPTNTQRAVSTLRQMIFSGELPAGSDHLETELAERLGLSRTPVREAILVLAQQGLVATRPRRGMRVTAISPKDMEDIYDVLTELEARAAERAAHAGYPLEELRLLRRAIDDMDAALAREDREGWADADVQFHRELLRLGGNARSAELAAALEDQVRRAKRVTLHMRPLPVQSNADHRAVLDAIAAGNAEGARARHHDHRRAAAQMLVDLLALHQLKHL